MSLCVGAHGWVAGIASRGSILLSRGWLIIVETPEHPGHSPFTSLGAVVKVLQYVWDDDDDDDDDDAVRCT